MLLFLLPAALQGGLAAQTSVICYSVVFVFYAVARIWRVLKERQLKSRPLTPSTPVSETVTE
jgi:hypothetical protein